MHDSTGINREMLSVVTAAQGDLEKACRDLIHAANGHGGIDNITVILVEFGA